MNNIAILKKVRDELQKEKPRFEYALGMLETLIEMQDPPTKIVKDAEGYLHIIPKTPTPPEPLNEADILEAQAKAALRSTMDLAHKMTDQA